MTIISKNFTASDLTLDDNNANKGTPRGRKLLEESLIKLGAGRSIVCDRNGKVIGGNKTLEQALAIGLEVETIHSQGDKLVAIIRDDLDLDVDQRARDLAFADNRIAELDMNWDIEKLVQEAEKINIENLWTEEEINQLHDELDLATFEAFAENTNEDEDAPEPNQKSDSGLVPFHCLLTPQQRERLITAIQSAKNQHGLETTAEALDIIAQDYINE